MKRGPKPKPITPAEVEQARNLLANDASQQLMRSLLRVSWRRFHLIMAAVAAKEAP